MHTRLPRRRTLALPLVVLLLVTTAVTTVQPVSAVTEPAAPRVVVLGADYFTDMVVVDDPDRIFLATDTGDEVLVLDHDGREIGTIGTFGDPGRMDVSADGSTIWIPDGSALTAYDTTTLEAVDAINLECCHFPEEVEVVGNTLVMSDRFNLLYTTEIGGDGSVSVLPGGLEGAGRLAHVPAMGDLVTVAEYHTHTDADAPTLRTVDVSGDPVVVATRTNIGSLVWDIDARPGTKQVTVSAEGRTVHRSYGAPTLNDGTTYSSGGAHPIAGDWSADGTHFAAGRWPTDGGHDVQVTEHGAGTAPWEYALRSGDDDGDDLRHLGLDADGTTLFAVVESNDAWLLEIVGVGYSAGTLTVDIRHDFSGYNNGFAPSGRVDLHDADTWAYLGTWTANDAINGRVRLDEVPAGDYIVVSYNGSDTEFEDFFPSTYREQPLFRFDRATTVTVRANRTTAITAQLRPLFFDMFGDTFEAEIFWMGNTGITKGCNPSEGNTLYCPGNSVTRGQMAAFLVRAFGLTDIDPTISFTDTGDSVFEQDILRLATAGITKGCKGGDAFCPDAPVTRGQMAAFMARAFGLPAGSATFADTHGSPFANDIARLADAGITRGCNPPQNTLFCPDRTVTRGQMAAFLFRGFTYAASTAAYDTAAFHAPATAPQRTATSGDRPDLGDR